MGINLFSNDCPRCKILKQKMDEKGIEYNTISEFDELIERGIMTLPVLKEGNEYMNFLQAIKWVNNK